MKLQFLRPMLRTQKFNDMLEFYTSILGFEVTGRSDEWGWANLRKDEVEIMIAAPNDHEPFEKPVFTGSFYFNTNNVDALWQDLKDKVKVSYEPESFEWGMKEFAVYDNNGYLLQFGQPVG